MRRFDSPEVRSERQLLAEVAIGRMSALGHKQPFRTLPSQQLLLRVKRSLGNDFSEAQN